MKPKASGAHRPIVLLLSTWLLAACTGGAEGRCIHHCESKKECTSITPETKFLDCSAACLHTAAVAAHASCDDAFEAFTACLDGLTTPGDARLCAGAHLYDGAPCKEEAKAFDACRAPYCEENHDECELPR
jgi:hypothetical protein